MDDLDYVRAEVPFLKRVSPEVNKQSAGRLRHAQRKLSVRGAFSSYQKIRHVDVAEEASSGSRKISSTAAWRCWDTDVKKKLFSGQDALGETVRIDGISYQVDRGFEAHDPGWRRQHERHGLRSLQRHGRSEEYLLPGCDRSRYEGEHEKVTKAVRDSMAFHHGFDPKDERAVFRIRQREGIGESCRSSRSGSRFCSDSSGC